MPANRPRTAREVRRRDAQRCAVEPRGRRAPTHPSAGSTHHPVGCAVKAPTGAVCALIADDLFAVAGSPKRHPAAIDSVAVRGRALGPRSRPYAQSRQMSGFSDTRALRWCTRKHTEHVNSSSCFGTTSTLSSSFDRSAPGSSNDSAASVSSSSILPEFASLSVAARRSASRLSSFCSSSLLREAS